MSKVIERIKKRVLHEQNSFQCMVLGATGTGKSFAALRFCEILDPTFNVERVVFTPEDFMELVGRLEAGQAILCDEIGSWLSGRDWQTVINKLMGIVLETYRFKRLIVFWTVPHQRMVDINLRGLCHATIETIAIDRSTNKSMIKFKYRTTNPMTGAIYERFPVTRGERGKLILRKIFVNRPSSYLEEAYLKKKEEHMEVVYEDIKRNIQEHNGSQEETQKEKNAFCECGNAWHYSGKYKYATCPSCRTKVKVTTIP